MRCDPAALLEVGYVHTQTGGGVWAYVLTYVDRRGRLRELVANPENDTPPDDPEASWVIVKIDENGGSEVWRWGLSIDTVLRRTRALIVAGDWQVRAP